MSKMNNWMMDIEDFCNGYFYDNHSDGNSFTMKEDDFTVDEIVEDVGMYFKSNEATKYAKQYLTTQMGEM
jgi:spore maturation protein CgeB